MKGPLTRINQHIRAPKVRLVDHENTQIGIVTLEDARNRAEEVQLDLVEVAPNSDPPVCKIMDYGRLVYDQKRRVKEQRKKAKHQELKEIKLRPNTDPHDYKTKVNHATDFLDKGHKVKFTIMYRGREITHYSRGTAVLRKIELDLAEIADVESLPSSRGRTQSMVVSPKKKAKAEKSEAPEAVE